MSEVNQQEEQIVNLVEHLQELYQTFQQKAGKDLSIILLIGLTGAGKSTIFNFLSGAEFEFQESDVNGDEIQVKQQNEQFSEIKGGMVSITKEPKYYFNEKYNHLLIDFPGFQDTRGCLEQLMIQLLFYKIVTTAPTKVVYVIRHPENHFTDRGVGLQEFIRQQFVEQQLEQWRLTLLLNSYNERLTNDKLKLIVQRQLEGIYGKANENIFVLRKILDQKQLEEFQSPKSRDKLWEQIIGSNIIKFIPKQLPRSEIISQYLQETSNYTIIQYCLQLNNILMNEVDNFTCQDIQKLKQSVQIIISILEKNKQTNLTDWYISFIEACDDIAKQLRFNYQYKTNCNNFIKIFCYFSQFQNFIEGYSDCEKAGLIADSQCQQMIQFISIKLKQLEDFQINQQKINEQNALLTKEEEKRKSIEKLLQQQLANNQLNEAERIRLQTQYEQVKQENQREAQNFRNQILQIQQNARREAEVLNRANQDHLNQLQLRLLEINNGQARLSQTEQDLKELKKQLEKKEYIENRMRFHSQTYGNHLILQSLQSRAELDYIYQQNQMNLLKEQIELIKTNSRLQRDPANISEGNNCIIA